MKELALHIVMVGHVDHGKSTVIGRLLYDTHALPEGTVDKVKRISKETGKPFEFAYLLDAFEEEQKQGITIDTTQLQFKSKKREYVIIDAPGHQEFLKNMISGASNAEAAFLIVDASRGVEEQTKRHAYVLRLLGIKKIYVLINKMDLVNYQQLTFESIKKEVADFLATLDVVAAEYLPISAYYGENMLTPSDKMPWYQGENFIDTLDSIVAADQPIDKPLRMPIQDVFKFDDRRIIAGRIEAGSLSVGDHIKIYPSGRETEVVAFANWAPKDAKTSAFAGQSVGIMVKDEFFNQRGEIITKVKDSKFEPVVANTIQANLFWMGDAPLVFGKTYKIKIATQQVTAKVLKIIKITDAATLEEHKQTQRVQLNDVAEVVFQTEQPLVYDFFDQHHATGRFVVVDGYDVAGGGTITKMYEGEDEVNGTVLSDQNTNYQLNLFDTYSLTGGNQISVTEYQGRFALNSELPLNGEGYQYPKNLHIILPRQNRILKVQNGKFFESIDLENEKDWQVPFVNSLGAKVAIKDPDSLKSFLNEQETLNDKTKAAFYNKWLDFNEYHQIMIEDI